MNDNPLVSVVIPTYNQASFLHKALQSVMNQTFSDWEAIVVNNDSTDNTVDVVQSFQDQRIILVNFKNYGIIAASRNRGIMLARGKWIAFLDSDDFWYPTKLERCLQTLHDSDIVCHGEIWVSGGIPLQKMKYGPEVNFVFERLLFGGNCLSTSAVMVRRDLLLAVGLFSEDPEFVTAEDYDLWLKLAFIQCKISFIDDMLGEYHLHSNNASKNPEQNTKAIFAVLNDHYTKFGHLSFENCMRLRMAKARVLSGAGRNLLRDGRLGEAGTYSLSALRLWPLYLKSYMILAGVAAIAAWRQLTPRR